MIRQSSIGNVRKVALESQGGFGFKVIAFTNRRNGPFGLNSERCSAKYKKRYNNSCDTHHEIHAEVDLILKMDSVPRKIKVARFLSSGVATMAKPCVHCQNFLRQRGVKVVRYTNWDGEWEDLKL
jgi:deoxycytidylate deaminase